MIKTNLHSLHWVVSKTFQIRKGNKTTAILYDLYSGDLQSYPDMSIIYRQEKKRINSLFYQPVSTIYRQVKKIRINFLVYQPVSIYRKVKKERNNSLVYQPEIILRHKYIHVHIKILLTQNYINTRMSSYITITKNIYLYINKLWLK